VRFGLLGPLAVWRADGTPLRIRETKVRALLADLLVHEGRPVPADRLVDDLWEQRPPANPLGALQTRVSQLRRALEDAEPGGRELVVWHPPGYRLALGEHPVDAALFADSARRANATTDPRAKAALLTEALALWRGQALADFADAQFARPYAHRLEEHRLTALEAQAEARLLLGEHALLADELAELVERHPLRERLRATHLRALYRAGRQGEALAGYQRLRQLLADELGLDPGPELVELQRAILARDPALELGPVTAAPVATRPRTNLPAPLTELIGRSEAVRELRTRLAEHRLVTLTGPGGVGKTRIALQTAAELAGSFPDGVWLVELAGATGELAELVAVVLGVRDDVAGPGRPFAQAERLAEAVRGSRMLLVLDNCEHVVEPVAELAGRLLRAAPGLHILATSQEPLGLTGELRWSVPPLELPADGSGAPPGESPAVRLFVARATAALSSFRLTDVNSAAVTAICRRLDGIPLALELAATRVPTLGVQGLAERLDNRFQLLTAGSRDAPARQRTLRAMLEWSWELLTAAEATVLRRLAVHVEGCTLAAAEAVCAGDGVQPAQVLDLVTRLADRSLVVVTDGADGSRYRLLESVAAYCVERLHEAGELHAARQRHRDHYTALAEGAQLRGPAQRTWLHRLDAEAGNLRAALVHATEQGDPMAALRLVNAQAWYWVLRGRLGEGRRSAAAALALPGGEPAATAMAATWQAGFALRLGEEATPPEWTGHPGHAIAHWFLGFAQTGFGAPADSERRVNMALAAFEAAGDSWGIAAALSTKSRHALARSDLPELARLGEQSRTLFRELGDHWGQLQAVFGLGTLAQITGDYAEAAALHQDGVRLAEELGLWTEVSDHLCQLGRVALLTGGYDQAAEYHRCAGKLAVEQGYLVGQEFAEVGLALGARRQHNLDDAEARLRHWLDWDRRMGSSPGMALILAELGFIAELRGDADAALAAHSDGLAAATATGDPRAVALAWEGLAGARALAGRHEHAARLLGAAAMARESAGARLPPAEQADVRRITAVVRRALGEPAFSAEVAAGAAQQLDADPMAGW
jgi:predicted ATPase/DNA-binding SARP family transcriptional activator